MKKIVSNRWFWVALLTTIGIGVVILIVLKFLNITSIFAALGIASLATGSLIGATSVAQRYDIGRPLRERGFPHPSEFRKGPTATHDKPTCERISFR